MLEMSFSYVTQPMVNSDPLCDPVCRSDLKVAEASQSVSGHTCCGEPFQSLIWEIGQ